MTTGLRTLVLHPDYSPINLFPLYTVPAEDAIVRVLQGTATCALEHDRKVLTRSRDDLFWPSVIVNKRVYKKRNEVSLKHSTLYYRDHGLCMYCETPLTTSNITCDHVMPKHHGGHHGWDNVVACCKPCNAAKADSLPRGKWVPKIKPYKPTVWQLIENRKKFPVVVDDRQWIDYIGPWQGEVIVRGQAREIPELV